MEKSNAEQRRIKSSGELWQEVFILLATIGAAGAGAYFYGFNQYEAVRLILLETVSCGCMIFAMEQSRRQHEYLFDNEENLWRFTVIYIIFLAASLLFPLLPAGGWPYLAVFIGLMLFGNQIIGICGGTALLLMTVVLTGMNTPGEFLLYFVSGMAGILVFSCLNESFQVGPPLLISLLVQAVCLCIREVLMVNETFRWQMLLIPGINVLICLILLLIILKFFSFSIIYRNRDLYMDINDPECPLLVELKNFSKEEYYHAIHTAYLCDRIAKRLSIDADAAKAGGYYHKIGILRGNDSNSNSTGNSISNSTGNCWENTEQILEEYHFPEKVRGILKEYLCKEERIVSKETVVLLISDTVIASIEYLFSKDPQVKPNYEKLVNAVYKKKVESGLLNSSRITMGELEEIKNILLEEKLYYDFLR